MTTPRHVPFLCGCQIIMSQYFMGKEDLFNKLAKKNNTNISKESIVLVFIHKHSASIEPPADMNGVMLPSRILCL